MSAAGYNHAAQYHENQNIGRTFQNNCPLAPAKMPQHVYNSINNRD
jgi:hypothetical protein